MTTQTYLKHENKTWTMQQNLILWSYTAFIRLIITYTALVRWPKIIEKSTQLQYQKISMLFQKLYITTFTISFNMLRFYPSI